MLILILMLLMMVCVYMYIYTFMDTCVYFLIGTGQSPVESWVPNMLP